jgi:hypothetical protein
MLRSTLVVTAILLTLPPSIQAGSDDVDGALQATHQLFYNGRYADASAAALELCGTNVVNVLRACEVRTSALHFMLRRAMGDSADREQAFAQCGECPALLTTFVDDTRRAVAAARAQLKTDPGDEDTLFLLGKLDLNYVWLQLGTLQRKTGWNEYWEARRSLDKVLKANPRNVRAKVARGWIDYIVDTKLPAGTRWLLGGGNRKRGLQAVREAAEADSERFVRAEAGFALWDMQVRENNIAGARATATMLAGDFPDNPDLRRFLAASATPDRVTSK